MYSVHDSPFASDDSLGIWVIGQNVLMETALQLDK